MQFRSKPQHELLRSPSNQPLQQTRIHLQVRDHPIRTRTRISNLISKNREVSAEVPCGLAVPSSDVFLDRRFIPFVLLQKIYGPWHHPTPQIRTGSPPPRTCTAKRDAVCVCKKEHSSGTDLSMLRKIFRNCSLGVSGAVDKMIEVGWGCD